MKKKLIIALAATLILGQVSIGGISGTALADDNKNTVKTISENQAESKTYTNDIFVKGLDVQGHEYHGAYIRFNVSDPENKKLVVTDMKGSAYKIQRHFGDSVYFAIELHDIYGNVKKKVELKGNDPLSKLNDIDGVTFEYGDYLKITHKEASNRLSIDGRIIDNFKYDKIPQWILEQYKYVITENGLRLAYETNQASESKETYWNSSKNEFSLNLKFSKGKEEFDTSFEHMLLIKDQKGNIVQKIKGYATNRYAEKPSNFNGSQFNINEETLKNLEIGKYFLTMQLNKAGKQVLISEIDQSEIKGTPGQYSDINKTGSRAIGNKEYKFKTEDSKTGRIILEVTEKSTQN